MIKLKKSKKINVVTNTAHNFILKTYIVSSGLFQLKTLTQQRITVKEKTQQ